MSIVIVLSALLAFAAAWPYPMKRGQFLQNVLDDAKMDYYDIPSMSPEQAIHDKYTEQQNEYAEQQEDPSTAPEQAAHDKFAEQQDEYVEQQGSGIQRVFSLDMTDIYQNCPSNLKLNAYGPRRLCGKKTNGRGCDSVTIPVGGQSYTEVHGRVIAYQYASTDAFNIGSSPGINGPYVDGISITYGSPRKHIWTLASGVYAYHSHASTCPGTGYGQRQPDFVANHYFCSSGNFNTRWSRTLYETPLWSTTIGDCSRSAHDVPYFCAKLSAATTENLELRICTNQGLSDEDVQIESINIYVR